MKLFIFGSLVVALLLNSCGGYGDYGSNIISPIVLSDSEHHVGDNSGAEGMSLSAEFEMPSSFSKVELEITFVHPDIDGTSGPDVDTPPEITINGNKVGVYPGDFSQFPDCITAAREFQCTITFVYDITEETRSGINTFQIKSIAFYDHADDFTFSDVLVIFQ